MSITLNDLTIVLPTRNEENNIRAFLGSIPDGVKLIVVDASTDRTPAIIAELRPERTIVVRNPGSVTEARQAGAQMAETTWLLFTDADVVFDEHYFDNLIKYQGYDLIYGAKLSSGDYSNYYEWFKWGQRLLNSIGIPAASGSNLLVRRKALMDAGGFDLRLTCNEDSELAWRVKRNGCSTAFAPELIVYARDHRRLHRGLIRKTLHSIIRCSLLYLNLIPDRWRTHDWGYWSKCRADVVLGEESKGGNQ